MRALTAAGLAMMLLGTAAIAVGVVRGEVSFALVLIVPIIYGSGAWALLGGVLIFFGFAVTFLSMMGSRVRRYADDGHSGESCTGQYDHPEYPGPEYPGEPGQRAGTPGTADQRRRSEFGGVIFLGPMPLLFGSGKSLKGSKFLLAMMIISAVLFVLFILGFLLR